jgi:hypothetical protein
MVAKEMEARKYKCDFERFAQYFPLGGYQEVSKDELFGDWHNLRYLRQCYLNLQEKFDCGGVPAAQWAAVVYRMGVLTNDFVCVTMKEKKEVIYGR